MVQAVEVVVGPESDGEVTEPDDEVTEPDDEVTERETEAELLLGMDRVL
jgi:hypothetical protein